MSSMFGMSVFIFAGRLGGGYVGCVHEGWLCKNVCFGVDIWVIRMRGCI